MDFENFAQRVVLRFGIDEPPSLDPWTGIFDDLGLDSLQGFELLIYVEALAGVDVPPPALPDVLTLGEAYDYYVSSRTPAAR